MFRGLGARAVRLTVIAAALSVSIVTFGAATAVSRESAGELQTRLIEIQQKVDALTASIEEREDEVEAATQAAAHVQERIDELQKRYAKLEARSVERARELYMSGNGQVLEVLFSSRSIAELSSLTTSLAQANIGDSSVFVDLARAKAEVIALNEELFDRKRAAQEALKRLRAEHERQQELFREIAKAYENARPEFLPSAARVKATGGMFCPVGGPTSFVDSWGAPRSGGRSHQGVDMMGAYGTPLVAVTSGTVTYSGYDGSGGNMIFLSGDDGHQYWYMHNQQNLVSGGRVAAGQRIATLGDTGNAVGTPHLHFEYHPGGGAPINPYPLVAELC
ncbi:MAG: peptidoglycan DD-metalloendopeptidase family protein [Actinomycetota bacterium]|nr:peptidoglycan DD-metalloendopeptidase family protein [Actinomycetota bacterium]